MCSFDDCSLSMCHLLKHWNTNLSGKLYALFDFPAIRPRPVFKKLLEFATKKSHFILDGQFYDQIDSPVLVNIVTCDFKGNWINNSPRFHATAPNERID